MSRPAVANETAHAEDATPRILLEETAPVAKLRLNRPLERNPLDWATIRELRAAVARIEANSDIRIVAISGQGRTFSAGGDMKAYIDLYRRPDDFRIFLEDFNQLLEQIETSKKIFVAIVEGYCVAGGIELLLACDISIASASARIGDGHVNFGQLPGAGGSQRLLRTVGPVQAKLLMLTGELISAAEAHRIGLVSAVVAEENLEAKTNELLLKLLAASQAGLSGAKHLVNAGMQLDFHQSLRMELEYVHTYATTHPDATEGLLAFAEKRKPRFSGT